MSMRRRRLLAGGADVAEHLNRLAAMNAEELRAIWPEHFGQAAPSRMRRDTLARFLSHRAQEAAFGGLPAVRCRTLDRLAEQEFGEAARPPARPSTRGAKVAPGTRLVREWQGALHEVTVTETGAVWNGTHYRSLSAVARAITGTRWNGPAFFGLRAKRGTSGARNG